MERSIDHLGDGDVVGGARVLLDVAAARVGALVEVERGLIVALAGLWPVAGWRAAGARSAEAWLRGCTELSGPRVHGLARVAELAASHPDLLDAIGDGRVSPGRAETLAGFVTRRREPFLGSVIGALVDLSAASSDDRDWVSALTYWAGLADQEAVVSRDPVHRVHLAPKLFGGGRVDAELSPSAFTNVAAALDAWLQDPDPSDAPYQRSLAERRADALDDLAHFGLTHDPGHDLYDEDDDLVGGDDVFDGVWGDGTHGRDELDVQLASEDGVSPLEAWRRSLQEACARQERRAARRTKRRSGVRVNVHIDLHTLAGRGLDDLAVDGFEGFDLHAEGWALARTAAERLLCDAQLTATLFAGRTGVLDVNDAAERFTVRQRRAIAARDRCCVFPGCTAPPRRCDVHHLHPREHGGATRTSNGVLLCRFHHRLVHENGWHLVRDGDHWEAVDPHGTTWSRAGPQPAAA